ncbi:hypothetical protein H0H87_002785, partial [Tephrocybe sp. NHM501043]
DDLNTPSSPTALENPPLFRLELAFEVDPDDTAPTRKRKLTAIDCVDVLLLNHNVKIPKLACTKPFKQRMVLDCVDVSSWSSRRKSTTLPNPHSKSRRY